MTKLNRMLEAYIKSLIETKKINKIMATLPIGYISVKVISKKTYYYRQWREGTKIYSVYVPEALYHMVDQQIVIRREYEKLLDIMTLDNNKYEKALLNSKTYSKEYLERIKNYIDVLDVNIFSDNYSFEDIINKIEA